MKLRSFIITAILFVMMMSLALPAFAQDKMTYEDYQALMQRWREREEAARMDMENIQKQLDEVNSNIAAKQADIDRVWDAIYAMLDLINPDDLNWYAAALAALGKELAVFEAQNPEQLYQNRDKIADWKMRYDELADHNAALLPRFEAPVMELGARYQAIMNRMAKPLSKTYTVVSGDHLWKIAGMRDHYNDPMKWMRIYTSNVDLIDDPDLIYPRQVFDIPMRIDERKKYLVAQGEFLSSIAQSVYGDPFKWRSIFEANQKFLNDPNVLYPEMILTLPGR
ncbi:LysM peptidoglycan-binding domain-containing protein [bacterium]|nr:LysM peptidoglycan-binding domain-containing protein [bacterium]